MRQVEFTLEARPRGVHLVTEEVLSYLGNLPETGLVHLLVKHTSCALALNENWDPDVRHDMAVVFDALVPEGNPRFEHTVEGNDDMPAHAKSVLAGVSLTLPVTRGRLNLGTWQGVYLLEFRNHGGPRKVVATILD